MSSRSTCLVLGSADTLLSDVARVPGPHHDAVACNEAGINYPGALTAWVTLHARYFELRGWRRSRALRGRSPAWRHYAHEGARQPHLARLGGLGPDLRYTTPFLMQPSNGVGSSGLFAVKVALVDLGFDKVILCGMPMDPRPHLHEKDPWEDALVFQRVWEKLPAHYAQRIRSMSGWTQKLFGAP